VPDADNHALAKGIAKSGGMSEGGGADALHAAGWLHPSDARAQH